MNKKRYTFDCETNGFLPDVSKIWMLVLENIDTGEILEYTSHYGNPNDPSIRAGLKELATADVIIGHNIIGYDLVVLKHLTGWVPLDNQTVVDTWILSQLVQYQRPHKHGLEGWGSKFGFPKLHFDKFDQYSDEMLAYCIRDVQLNTKVYNELAAQSRTIIQRNPLFAKGIEVEMEFAKIESDIRQKGWVFDLAGAEKLLAEIQGKLDVMEDALEPLIGMRCIKKDGLEPKEPAWRKDGCYTVNTAKWFDVPIESGRGERPIEGPYSRISFEQGKVSSIEVVKDYLFSIGWEPDEYNVERINGKFVNKSPKLTESSLSKLGPSGVLISEYYTVRSRKGILEGWIKEVQRDGRLHGRMWTIGTPTFRCRHEVVANLPSVDSVYGKEMRSLLICEEGMSIVGADSAGNQMRGLCHYIGNDAFTNEVINGDVHQKNADILSKVYPCPRKTAKPWLYSYLFGAGDGKSGLILTGKRDAAIGKRSKELFESSIPGLKNLKEQLDNTFERTENAFGKGNGFIRGIDGRTIFVKSKHMVLNYLLQTLEGITCKAATVYLKKKLVEKGIPHYFALMYHDEVATVIPEKYAEEVEKLSVEAFTEAPKTFGVMCMNGSAHTGKDYAQVH